MPRATPARYLLIGIAVLLMAALVYVVGSSLQAGRQEARLLPATAVATPTLPLEAGVFRRPSRALEYAAMPAGPSSSRPLAVYHARRAYPGAPPLVPHTVDDPSSLGKACLACHADGGWVPRFAAYAPVVPHPELVSCGQCHVVRETSATFAASTWQTLPPPSIGQAAMPGSPPPIPHHLQMRENCLACHAGPAAMPEIRTTHPDRVSCRQCHALGAGAAAAFERPGGGVSR